MFDGKPLPESLTRAAWRAAVAEVAAKAKAALPECNGRVEKAAQIVLAGDVDLLPDGKAENLAALVPLPRVHLVRYGGCLALHSHLRGAIIPTPRQQGVDEEQTETASPRWSWARLLKRVVALDMARCPWCQRGALRIIAAITQGEVIRKILCHLKRAADPPPMAPARVRQEAFSWSSA